VALLATYLAYFSTLKMEAVCSAETSTNVCQTTWRPISALSIVTAIRNSNPTITLIFAIKRVGSWTHMEILDLKGSERDIESNPAWVNIITM
jgi:hypothetical protein